LGGISFSPRALDAVLAFIPAPLATGPLWRAAGAFDLFGLLAHCGCYFRRFSRVKRFVHTFLHILLGAGAFGVLGLAFLDSTFLIIPLGIDLLVIALSARHPTHTPWYVLAATVGSVVGCWTTIWLGRKGEGQIKKHVPRKNLKYFQNKMEEHSILVVAVAALMPPPFPFTAVVATAAALHHPRKKLLIIIGASRLVRFSVEAGLAVHYGRYMIATAQSPEFNHLMLVVIGISVLCSAFSIYRWIGKSRSVGTKQA
jgi:membrane protein YqaA with SNARE-associated domain